jgi:hypothetical protein
MICVFISLTSREFLRVVPPELDLLALPVLVLALVF